MSTSHRPFPAHGRLAAQAAGLALASLLVTSACGNDTADGDTELETPAGLATGIPETWAAGITDGKERYPDISAQGQGDFAWECPLVESVEVDGETMDSTMTTFWKLDDDTFEVECEFYPPTPASLMFAQAGDDTAFAELVDSTDAFEQTGNEQVQSEVTIGERDFVLVTWTYPTNPEAGTKHVACYLDEATLSRACLDIADSDERSKTYDAEQAAAELSAILSS